MRGNDRGRTGERHGRGWFGVARGAERPAALEPLEQRVLMSADVLEAGVGSFSVSTVAHAALVDTMDSMTTTAPAASIRASDFSSVQPGAERALIGLDQLLADPRFAGIDGRGFTTVVIDTGADLDHSFFGPDANGDGVADRIVYQHDFADNDRDASDVSGHGTNVAGIIGSSNGAYAGVAPLVNLVVLKVFGNNGAGTFAMIERALQWVVQNAKAYNVSSVNLSLGDQKNWASQQRLYGVSDELAKLASMNVKVVAAAGNAFYQFLSAQGVSYPAADPSVIGVGAVFTGGHGTWQSSSGASAEDIGADEVTPFSQRHATLTPIFAPGSPMVNAGLHGGLSSMQGTSQASPVIAGVAVLADQIATRMIGRKLTVAEFRSMIVSTGVTIVDGDNETDNVRNTGRSFKRVDAYALADAVARLGARSAPKAAAPATAPKAQTPTASTQAPKAPAPAPKEPVRQQPRGMFGAARPRSLELASESTRLASASRRAASFMGAHVALGATAAASRVDVGQVAGPWSMLAGSSPDSPGASWRISMA